MGWPKKNEEARLYFERKTKSYLMVFLHDNDEDKRSMRGNYEAIGELLIHNNPERPMLCSCSASPIHLYKKCRRVEWSDMPKVWQQEMKDYINGDPEEVRGLWKVGNQPTLAK